LVDIMEITLDHYKPVDTCQVTGLQYILAGIFGLKSDGTYVEVGAYDGITYSNTYQLAKLGWRGILFEPMPHLYNSCLEVYKSFPNVELVNKFVSYDFRTVTMYKYGDLYSGDARLISQVGPGWEKAAEVETTTLWYELDMRQIDEFDVLVIDAEGHDLDVLHGLVDRYHMDLASPKMVIVESCAYHTDRFLNFNSEAIDDYMTFLSYKRIYADIWNGIYIK